MWVLKTVTFITKNFNLPHIVEEANLRTILIKKIKVQVSIFTSTDSIVPRQTG